MDALFFKDWFEYGANIKFAVSQIIYQTKKMFRRINKNNESRD